jgi:hypothetical protein
MDDVLDIGWAGVVGATLTFFQCLTWLVLLGSFRRARTQQRLMLDRLDRITAMIKVSGPKAAREVARTGVVIALDEHRPHAI